ncbi:hypothetical protein FC80_GL000336 [Liquorilactobacillus cacaonum DSM 21116]|uniref:DUF951 domain-containing protein n=2 Tax=Liquorilactobacillus cacaonum TaxID=483012 RepID=A0A0R2CL37_9LACO|nr:hypothetical protein FC80_GL000336 [Liquorilactobacillus cacaonum DSM 21116]
MKMQNEYELHDVVEMKKPHPCGTNNWEIVRLGMDIKIKCTGCGHLVMLPRREFNRKLKKILKKANIEE